MADSEQQKKEEIELVVQRILDSDSDVSRIAMETLAWDLKQATVTVTSVPLPLKYSKPFSKELEEFFISLPAENANKILLAQLLSIIFTAIPNTERKALKYCLLGNVTAITEWGSHYLRSLSGEIAAEYNVRQTQLLATAYDATTPMSASEPDMKDLFALAERIVPYYMKHHNEIDAIDLLLEISSIEMILEHVDKDNWKRMTDYLLATSKFTASDDDFQRILNVIFQIFLTQELYVEASRVALRLGSTTKILEVVRQCKENRSVMNQIQYLFSQHGYEIPPEEFSEDTKESADSIIQTEMKREDIEVTADNPMEPNSDQSLSELGALSQILTSSQTLSYIRGNEWLSETYRMLAKELDVLEPKTPEEVYKSHLEDRRGGIGTLDSSKQNLASSFVNGFVNAGFCSDKLVSQMDPSWIYRHREHGLISAAASLGLIYLWNVEDGLSSIDQYQWSDEPSVKAGALLAFGIVCSSVRNVCDPAFVLLSEQLESSNVVILSGAILGLGIAYAGAKRMELLELMVPFIVDTNAAMETSTFAALALGLSFVGTCNEPAAEALMQALLERQYLTRNLDSPLAYLFGLSLALLFLGRGSLCEATVEALEAVSEHPIGRYAAETVLGFAYAGSGDVTKVQHFLKECVLNVNAGSESAAVASAPTGVQGDDQTAAIASGGTSAVVTAAPSPSRFPMGGTRPPAGGAVGNGPAASASSSAASMFSQGSRNVVGAAGASTRPEILPSRKLSQATAVMGVVLVALGEELGKEMTLRMLDHILQYGTLTMRQTIPIALALHSTSNPKPNIIELLSKLTHDNDPTVALHAIFALGIVGAGTNNSKIGDLLRQLASYYRKNSSALFVTRLAQGILYLGKGLLTLNPLHSDGLLLNPVALGSLLVVLHTSLFMKQTILGRFHYLLFFLAPAMRSRMLLTVDEDLAFLPTTVRVGQAVDTAGQAGNPRSFSGFQTNTTPVLLTYGDRAGLATTDYEPVTSMPLEGVVIVRKVKSAADVESSVVKDAPGQATPAACQT